METKKVAIADSFAQTMFDSMSKEVAYLRKQLKFYKEEVDRLQSMLDESSDEN
jgi:predicted transcriptional regulator